MYHIVLQEITESGHIEIHRVEIGAVDNDEIDYWEKYYSKGRDNYDSSSYNSTAVCINVFQTED